MTTEEEVKRRIDEALAEAEVRWVKAAEAYAKWKHVEWRREERERERARGWVTLRDFALILAGGFEEDVEQNLAAMNSGRNRIMRNYSGESIEMPCEGPGRSPKGYRADELIDHWVKTGNLEAEEAEAYLMELRAKEITL